MKKLLMFLLSIVGVGAVVNEQKTAKHQIVKPINISDVPKRKDVTVIYKSPEVKKKQPQLVSANSTISVYRPSGVTVLSGLQKYRMQVNGDPSQPVREAGSFERARLN